MTPITPLRSWWTIHWKQSRAQVTPQAHSRVMRTLSHPQRRRLSEGSVAKSIKDNAENATFTPAVGSGITSVKVVDAVNELGVGKVNTSDIVDGLDSTSTDKPLSAKQGKVVNDRIDNILTEQDLDPNKDSELVDARGSFDLLSNRLDNTDNAMAISVEKTGAVGDGVTDDTIAIKSAITLAGENGTLIFPPNKTYLISSKLYALAGQTWYGYGACLKRIDEISTTTTDSITTTTNPTIITVADSTGFTVGMQVTVTEGRNNTDGCYVSHTITAIDGNLITITGNFTKAFATGGTFVTNFGLIACLSGTDNFKIFGLELDGNRANNDSYLNWQSQNAITSGSNRGVFKDLYIHDSQADGIMLGGIGAVLDSCTILNSGGNAIHLSGATGVKVVNNYCKDATLSITGTDNTTGPDHAEGVITFSSYIEDTIIASNHLENARTCIGGIGVFR